MNLHAPTSSWASSQLLPLPEIITSGREHISSQHPTATLYLYHLFKLLQVDEESTLKALH